MEGSIPAWAGKPWSSRPASTPTTVHPRVGGETRMTVGAERLILGPSPRGRGNHPCRPLDTRSMGSIPAWAGKPLRSVRNRSPSSVHPRVGGETSISSTHRFVLPGPSPRGRGNPSTPLPTVGPWRSIPRGRGNRCIGRFIGTVAGSIPAWAGKPRDRRLADYRAGVHPRVGGETCCCSYCYCKASGPSPRGRGNRATRVPEHRG